MRAQKAQTKMLSRKLRMLVLMLYVLQNQVKKKTTKIGVTTNRLDQWSDDHVLKLQRSFLRAMIEIIQNEVNTLDPVYITNSEICWLWNLIGGIYKPMVQYTWICQEILGNNAKSIWKDLMYQLQNKRVEWHFCRDKTIRKRYCCHIMSSDVEI